MTDAYLEKIREDIVLRAMFFDQEDPVAIEQFDRFVCLLLKVDADEVPPLFIEEALAHS
jgi:hypothetical protein|tara:strand:+ start:115 stop:291 length:177 start_codon:yes stop_codon:yes gene_type:complete